MMILLLRLLSVIICNQQQFVFALLQSNEWMNEWLGEWMIEWMNEWMNELIN